MDQLKQDNWMLERDACPPRPRRPVMDAKELIITLQEMAGKVGGLSCRPNHVKLLQRFIIRRRIITRIVEAFTVNPIGTVVTPSHNISFGWMRPLLFPF